MDILLFGTVSSTRSKKRTPQLFTMFSTQIIPVSFSEDHMIIAVTKPYLIMWLKKIYWKELNEITAKKIGHPIHISVQILQDNSFLPAQETMPESPSESPAEPDIQTPPNPPDFSNLKPKKPEEVKLPDIQTIIERQQETLFSPMPEEKFLFPQKIK